jgi:hypothetical protein
MTYLVTILLQHGIRMTVSITNTKKNHSHIEKWQRNILDTLRMIKQASRWIVPLVQNELLYNFSFYFTA